MKSNTCGKKEIVSVLHDAKTALFEVFSILDRTHLQAVSERIFLPHPVEYQDRQVQQSSSLQFAPIHCHEHGPRYQLSC